MRVALCAFALLALAGCWRPGDNDTVRTDRGGSGRITIFTDQETGCQYLAHNFGSITPRLDRDGSIMCSEDDPNA